MSRIKRSESSLRASSWRLMLSGLLLGSLVWLGSGLLDSASAAKPIAPADWEKLSRGQVVVHESAAEGDKIPMVEARILIPSPPDQVWPIVSDPLKLMKQEEKVKEIKYLSQDVKSHDVEITVNMSRLLPAFQYVLRQELMAPLQIKFRRVSGSFRDIQGFWELIPVEGGNKTVLSYQLQLDPGPLVPKGLMLSAVKSDLPTMMQNAKRAIEGQ